MIPNEAYNLAREGGWKPKNEDYLIWQIDALDPAFFQALGKSLGWNGKVNKYWFNSRWEERWYSEGLRFYDLILINGDTATYWKEILK